jgi:hypothetical protein
MTSFFKSNNYVYILVFFWLAINSFLLLYNGIESGLESLKYIHQANLFLETGRFSSGNFLFYSVPILLIAFAVKTGMGYGLVVAIQLILNGISVYCFYKLVRKLTRSEKLAFIYTIAFLGMIYYQLYNFYLYSESLFFSLSIIYTYLLFNTDRYSTKTWISLLIVLCLLYLTRPVGIFFIPATFIYILFRFYRRKALAILAIAVVVFLPVFYFLLNYSLGSGGELDFLLPYQDERIICGVPTISAPHKLNVPGEKNSIGGLAYVITHHWDLFSRLAVKRLGAFFGVTRSFYSTGHNLFLCLYFYPLYIFIIAGMRKMAVRYLPEFLFMLVILILTVITVILSCDEWHNRFILAILPFILLLSTAAFFKKNDNHVEPASR